MLFPEISWLLLTHGNSGLASLFLGPAAGGTLLTITRVKIYEHYQHARSPVFPISTITHPYKVSILIVSLQFNFYSFVLNEIHLYSRHCLYSVLLILLSMEFIHCFALFSLSTVS